MADGESKSSDGQARRVMKSDDRDIALQAAVVSGQFGQPPMAVLFIDPDVTGTERLARHLKGRYAIAVVPTAQAAWSAMSMRMPDLVVTELDLPDADGLQVLTQLRSTPTTQHILLMVVTKHSSINDKIAAFQAGGDDFLVKPVEPEKFETHLLLVSRFRKIIPT
jgi:DNA-binding response OmpR family regulator